MANQRENYYIKLILEAVDRSSPAFNALERQITDLNKKFRDLAGVTEEQVDGQERLAKSVRETTKAKKEAEQEASNQVRTTKEQIQADKELARERNSLRKAEADLARTRSDSASSIDDIFAAEQRVESEREKLATAARQRRISELEQETLYSEKILNLKRDLVREQERLDKETERKAQLVSQFTKRQSDPQLLKLREELEALERRRKLLDDYLKNRNRIGIEDTRTKEGKPYASRANAERGLTKVEQDIRKAQNAIAKFTSEKIPLDGLTASIDDLGYEIDKNKGRINTFSASVKGLEASISKAERSARKLAEAKFVDEGGEIAIARATELIELDERAAAQGLRSIELQTEAAKERAAQDRAAGLERQKLITQEKKELDELLERAEKLGEETKKTGTLSEDQNRKITKELQQIRKEYALLGGTVNDVNKAFSQGGADAQRLGGTDAEAAIDRVFKKAQEIEQIDRRLQKVRSDLAKAQREGNDQRARVLEVERNLLGDEIALKQDQLAEELKTTNEIIENRERASERIDVEFRLDPVSATKLEFAKLEADRDIEVEVDFNVDQGDLTALAALGGALNAFSEGTDRASRGIAAFDNVIRGLLVLGIALFFEQLLISAIGLVGALTALASAAVAAGSALAGALAAGAVQAAPAIGVLAAFANRVGNVFNAVKQANLLQQQESYKGAQAAGQQANSLDAVVAASERVKEAQEAVTEARKKAREALEDLILSERRQTISAKEAQLALRSGTGGGILGAQGRQVAAEEAQLRLSRTRTNLRERTAGGIEGSPEVTAALKNLEEAQRGLAQARQSATQAGTAVDATTGKLNFLLSGLSGAERRLYRALIELQDRWRKFAQQISEPLTNSFVFAINRINAIFKNSDLINIGKSLGESLGQSFRTFFDFFLSDQVVGRVLGFADDFQRNLIPLTNIAINLTKIFLDVAEAGNPVLAKLLEYFDKIIQKFSDFTGSDKGKNQLAEFFDAGTDSLLKFFDLAGALGNVILALIGTPGSGLGLDAGNKVLDQLIEGLNNLAEGIRDPSSKIGEFFRRFFRFATEIIPIFSPIISAIGEGLNRVFSDEGIDALKGFSEFVSRFVIPAITDFIFYVAKVTEAVVRLTEQFPILGEAIQGFIAVALTGSVLGRVTQLLAPFQSLFSYAFLGTGKNSIFKILQNDAEKGLPSIQRFIEAWEKSDALVKPGRLGLGRRGNAEERAARAGRSAAGEFLESAPTVYGDDVMDQALEANRAYDRGADQERKRGRGRFGTISDRVTQRAAASNIPFIAPLARGASGGAGAAGAAGAASGAANTGRLASLGAALGPQGLIIAGIAAVTAAIVGLIALSGRLDDVWKAIKETFSDVFSVIKDSLTDLAKEITGESDAKAAFEEILSVLKDIGSVLADVVIVGVKIFGTVIGATVVNVIKVVTSVVRAFKRIFSGVIDIFKGIKTFWENIFSNPEKALDGVKLVGEGILKIFGGLAGLLFDILKNPFESLADVISKVFPGIGKKIESIFASVINFFIRGINEAIRGINAVSPFGDIQPLDEIQTPEQRDRQERQDRRDAAREIRNSRGPSSRRILQQSRDTRQYRSEQRAAGRNPISSGGGNNQRPLDREVNNQDAEKFLTTFNPRTVKLSEEIKNKVAEYWRSLRRGARTASNEVISEVREMRTRSLRSLADFVEKARDQMRSLNTSFRNRMVSIANITRNQMLNVKLAVYDAAVYIRRTLKSVLDELGAADTKISIKVEEPKKAPTGADVNTAATGGWIGNRGERGRDMVPTLLGRGEAVLNWQQQRLVEPALRQTYGFGLDGVFDKSKGYHAGGPGTAPGFARGRRPSRGARDGIYTASVFSDAQGYKGDALARSPYNWAELGVNGGVGNAFGGLPYRTKIRVSYRGRSVNLTKLDIGSGGPGIAGKIRAVDIWQTAANKLRLPGLANVYVSFTGGTGGTGGALAAMEEIAMPKIQGGSRVMREAVRRATKKMVDAANEKLASVVPEPTGAGDIVVPRGRVSGNLQEAIAMGRRMGLVLSSFLRPGDTDSFHSQGRAADLSGSPEAMARFFRWALRRYGRGLTELFYDPLGGIDNGVSIGKIGDHMDHVHIAFNRGGKLTSEMIRRENEAQRKRKRIQRFAYGGTVQGSEGQAVPIIAHAGEWVLNRRHQNRLAAMAGTTADHLKGMLGFTGGPTSFAGSGEVRSRAERRARNILDNYQLPSLLPLNIDDTVKIIETINKQIRLLNNTSIKKYRRDFKTFLDRLTDLTDPENGVLARLGENIQRVFDNANRSTLLQSVGLSVSGKLLTTKNDERSRLTRGKPEADAAKLAEARAQAQEELSKDLESLRNRYAGAIIQIQRKIRDVTRKVGRGDSGRGGFDKRIADVEKEIKRLEKGDEDSGQKKSIKELEETLKKLKSNRDTYNSLVSGRRDLIDKISELEDKIIEAENTAFEERKTAFEETTNNLLKAGRRTAAIAELKKQLAEYGATFNALTGTVGQTSNPTEIVIQSLTTAAQEAKDRVEILRKRLAEAQAKAAADPRWQAVVDQLEEEFGTAVLDSVQRQAEVVSGAISEVERVFQRAETGRAIREQSAALAERTLGILNGGFGSQVTDVRRGILRDRADGVRGQITALTNLRDTGGFTGQALEDLQRKIEELTKTAESLDQDIIDLNQTYRRQLVEAIQARTQRSTGLFGNAEQILGNIARAAGIEDPTSRLRAAQATGDALQGERGSLIDQVFRAINSNEEFSQESRDLLQTLLTSFQSGDPGSFANLLFTLGPAISALESTLGETERGALNSLIDSLVNNSLAVTENTANLRELNGLANQPQAFSTTSWTRFRAAIFNGLGDVLPQFDIPQMATGGYITKGGMFELHPGEFVVNPTGSNIDQGDINITVNEANKPLDVTALASRIAFEKRTRK